MLKKSLTAVVLTLTWVLGSLASAQDVSLTPQLGGGYAPTQASVTTDPLSVGTNVKASTSLLNNLDESLTKTVGGVRPQAIEKHAGSFDSYWNASRPQREGKAFEAILADTTNRRVAATGGTQRIIPTAHLGYPQHAADLIELDNTGRVVRRIQSKLGFDNVLGALRDPKYAGMDIVTDQNTLDSLRKELAKRAESASARGVSLPTEHRALQEALDSGRLWQKLPCGAPLPTREYTTQIARQHAERLWNARLTSVASTVDDAARAATGSVDNIARAGTVTDDVAHAAANSLDDAAKTTLANAGKVVTKAVPVVATAYEVYQRGSEVAATERQFAVGQVSQQQREVLHARTAGKAVGGFTGATAGATGGATLGTAVGSVAGPPGAVVGGVVFGIGGAVVGGLGGELVIGEAAAAATGALHRTGTTIKGAANSAANYVGSWFSW